MINFCRLRESPSSGNNVTWCSNQLGRRRIVARLDRALYNLAWIAKFSGWKFKVFESLGSDHSPLFGEPCSCPKPCNIPFKFNMCWTDHVSFLSTVKESWEQPMGGAPLQRVMKKLQRLKRVLKNWNRSVFGDLDNNIKSVKEDFTNLQMAVDQNLADEVMATLLRDKEIAHETALSNKNSFIKQKSSVKMELEGERNTTFFHTMLKINQGHSLISEIENEEGRLLTSQADIKEYMIQFFKDKFKAS
ncbi:Dnase i-like superfamily protein [Thalictrum thalictroides]|uniref:Dnase i-like superfamily protein n=1 Tax=Thalictrum thalictroides TaxID=46969 RepID=A0A7J6UWJ1_THATH|nr:Dnase i-like superfamily protein [Thalictrum thalictroides]